MSSTILDYFSVWSSGCPSDEEIDLSDCSDDSPEFAVLEQPTGTLITSAGIESRALREAGSSTGGTANFFFASKTTGRSAGGAAINSFSSKASEMAISDKAQKPASYAVKNGNF